MPNTVNSAVQALRLLVGDTNADAAKQVLGDADYEPMIVPHCSPATQWSFQRITPGYYGYLEGPLALFGPTTANSPFVTTATEWTLNCAVPSIYGAASLKLTAGSDSAETILVTGARINWPRVMEDVLVFIATHKARQYSQTIGGGGSISPETARAELLRQAEVIRGARAL